MQESLATVQQLPTPGNDPVRSTRPMDQPRRMRPPVQDSGRPIDLWAEPWVDLCPEVERGHHPLSPYVELYWLAVLGPSATWLIRRLAILIEESPGGLMINTADIAGEIGLGSRPALYAAFDRAFERCCRFGLIQRGRHDTVFVRLRLPNLTARMAHRLPRRLRAGHAEWQLLADTESNESNESNESDELERARRLAMALLACGDAPDSVERQLQAWQFHPAMAFEGARWATEQHERARAALAD